MTVEQASATFAASAPSYQNIAGLTRKHYLLGDDGRTAGGVYLWESREAAEALYDDEWKARVTARYGAAPVVEYFASPVTVDPGQIVVG